MNGNGKRAAVNMVGSIKQLLKKLCVRIDTKKLKLESLSGIKANRATFSLRVMGGQARLWWLKKQDFQG